MSEALARGVPARIGIAALNLLAPGLGLLRVQRLRAAILFLLAPAATIALVLLIYVLSPVLDFRRWAALMAVCLVAILVIYLAPIVMSWRASRGTAVAGPWWSRWYGLLAAFVLVTAVNWPLAELARSHYRSFYLPAESMTPTLAIGDRLVARMRAPATLRRGTIILLRVGNYDYIKRIAALPGDRIAMREGIVILNGRPVPQTPLGEDRVAPTMFGATARRLAEQFPGEARPHQVYDLGYSPFDDMDEVVVAPGHVFVLGDNRDQSADSRVPRAAMGIEQAPVGDIEGVAQFIYWSADRSRIGTRLDD
jgi:signal peptidase I